MGVPTWSGGRSSAVWGIPVAHSRSAELPPVGSLGPRPSFTATASGPSWWTPKTQRRTRPLSSLLHPSLVSSRVSECVAARVGI